MSLLDQKKFELKRVMDEQKSTIRNYCDAIGCKECPLKEPDTCHSLQLQDRECNLENEIEKLEKNEL